MTDEPPPVRNLDTWIDEMAHNAERAMTDLFPVTQAEMIAEVAREIGMRRDVYPRLVAAKKLDRAVADRRIAILEAVLARLRGDAS